MPIKSCKMPDGNDGWQWGNHGHCYADRADAEKQAEAAHANGWTGDSIGFALDRSLRTKDADGRLHVAVSNISKAVVNPYRGDEIPGHRELGLDPTRIYMMLRDPDELARGANTFNNIPLLSAHIPVSADDPQKDAVVGATGTDAEFVEPYLRNSLVIWDSSAIAGIETREQCELSCAYRYVPDMTPGTFEGVPYDGRMTNIVGNHVALVEIGRAGPDVVVSDQNPFTEIVMPKGKTKADRIAAELKSKFALDAKLEDIRKIVMDAQEMGKEEDEEDEAAEDEDDETEEERKKREAKEKADKEGAQDDPGATEGAPEAPDKKAMDAAIRVAKADAEKSAIKRMQAIAQAEKDVRPLIGDIAAMDSAEAVYKLALDQAGIDVTGVHPSAYAHIIKMHIETKSAKPALAKDAALAGNFWADNGLPEPKIVRI